MNHSIEQIPESLSRIRKLREQAGRDTHIELTMGLPVGTPEDLDRYGEEGVTRVLVRPWKSTKDALESIERFATAVLNR
jgi:hypothetical protein